MARLNDTSNLCVCRYHYYYLVTALSPRFRGARLLIYGFVYEPGEDAHALDKVYHYWEYDMQWGFLFSETCRRDFDMLDQYTLFVQEVVLEVPIMYDDELHEGKWLKVTKLSDGE